MFPIARMMALMIAAGMTLSGCAWFIQTSRDEPPVVTTAEPALREELLAMRRVDQEVRQATDWAAMAKVDAEHTARMKAIIARHGWPGRSLVGEDGANAAWILVQHADADRGFQQHCLGLLEAAVKRGDASPTQLAYLTDRLEAGAGRPQIYGTQFVQNDYGEWVPQPIADEAHVDARRQAVGLGSLAEGIAEMNRNARPKKVLRAPAFREALVEAYKAAKDAPESHSAQAARLRALVKAHGWPTVPLVGEEGVGYAIWLATEGKPDLPFLRQFVAAQKTAFDKGETSGWTYAYLVDKALIAEGKRQRYGSVFVWIGDEYSPSPIEDEANVDQRRTTLGLPALAEYTKMMRHAAPPRKPATP